MGIKSENGQSTSVSKKSGTKMVSTTLDCLPAGDDSSMPHKGDPFKKADIPDGVSRKKLYADAVRIAWPSFVELVLTQLTSMADQIMVGRLPGEDGVRALSAVGLSAQPKFLLMTMMQALNVGSTAMVARFRGQGNREKANQVFRQSLLFNLVLSFFFMMLGIFTASPMLRIVGGSGISNETYAFAKDYFLIQMYGFVPLCITFTFTAVLRGIGDTRTPLIYNTMANAINLVFNYFLIYGKCGFPKMEVAGASLATIIGQTAAFFFALIFVMRKDHYVYLSFREKFRLDFVILSNVIHIGIPSMIEQLFLRAGVLIYGRAVAGLGDVSYATHQVCMNIQAMSFMTGQAFANSATTLAGQSLGKKRYDMAEIYVRYTRRISFYVSVVLGLALIFFGTNIVYLYNTTPEVVSLGGKILIMVGFIQPFQSIQFVLSGALRGAGDTRYPAVVMFITVLIVRSCLALVFINLFHWGLWGAWYALVADQILRAFLVLRHYNTGKWRFMRIKGEK